MNVSELKCKMAASVYHKFIKESYGITDCCGEYDHNEIDDTKLLIQLYCGPFNIDDIRNGFKEYKPKERNKVDIKPKSFYVHNQADESEIWYVTHNLNRNPNVNVFDNDNNKIVGIIEYTTSNSLNITFSSAKSGKAYLS